MDNFTLNSIINDNSINSLEFVPFPLKTGQTLIKMNKFTHFSNRIAHVDELPGKFSWKLLRLKNVCVFAKTIIVCKVLTEHKLYEFSLIFPKITLQLHLHTRSAQSTKIFHYRSVHTKAIYLMFLFLSFSLNFVQRRWGCNDSVRKISETRKRV